MDVIVFKRDISSQLVLKRARKHDSRTFSEVQGQSVEI